MTTTFNQGDRVFTLNGRECELVATLSEGFIVRRFWLDEDGEEHPDELAEEREVFAKPPVEKKHAEIVALDKQLADLRGKLDDARREERELAQKQKERTALLEEHKAVARIADFIAGKITHFVLSDDYGRVEVSEKLQALSHGDGYDRDLKLVTLFGRSNGDLQWRINRYSDGSGGWSDAIPCSSLEEARELAQQQLVNLFADPKCNYHDNAVKSAGKLGFEVPVHVTEHLRAAALSSAREAVERAEKDATAARAKLAELERAS